MYHQDYEFLHTVEGKREKSLDCLLAQRDLSEKKKWMSRSIDDEMKQEMSLPVLSPLYLETNYI